MEAISSCSWPTATTRLAESSTANNTDALPIALSTPHVDLATASPTESQSSAQAGNGQQLTFSWKVSNAGTNPAAADRTDAVYLANATTLAAATQKWQVASVDTSDQPPLAGGSNTTESSAGTLPNVPAGNYDLVFVLNDAGSSTYGDQSETSLANNETSLPLAVTRPSVDLKLQTASLSTPSTITEGSQATVSYTVENLGSDCGGRIMDRRDLSLEHADPGLGLEFPAS